MHLKRLATTAAATITLFAAGLTTAVPASADLAGGDCDASGNSVCLYYRPTTSGYGAVFQQNGDIPNYSGYTFSCGKFGCSGAGQQVRNNAAAVDSFLTVNFTVYYYVNYNCSYSCQVIPPYGLRNLNGSMRNNNASGRAG